MADAAVRSGHVELGGAPGVLLAVGTTVYALDLWNPSWSATMPATILRIDVARRRVAAWAVLARPVKAGSVFDDSLYVLVSDASSGSPAAASLLRLDAHSLRVLAQTRLSTSDASLVARPEGVYVLEGPRLKRRDSRTLAVRATLALPFVDSPGCSAGGALASDPGTRTGWVVIAQQGGVFRIAEIDLPRLSLRHVSAETGGVCSAAVSAMRDGVWAAFPTGMLSDAERVATRTGEVDAHLHADGDGRFYEPNSAAYQVSPTALWIRGVLGLSCADSHTGRVLASTELEQSPGGVAMAASRSWVVIGVERGVDLYAPTAACR